MSTIHELTEQIEHLVQAHIAATHTAVAAAVARVFAASAAAGDGGPRALSKNKHAGALERQARAASRRKPAPRRPLAEVMALAERFYAIVCRSPGETMATMASKVGASPRELQIAVGRLKRAGRVRAVGQRQFTRYFPMAMAGAAAAAA